jgi:hypothetical protein
MRGLFLFIGESFRSGGQYSRKKGLPESFEEQIKASQTHIHFIQQLEEKFQLEKSKSVIVSYNTRYNQELLDVYGEYVEKFSFYQEAMGLNNLFHTALKDIPTYHHYDFIFYIRIDLFLKEKLLESINHLPEKILFANICWTIDCICQKLYPRVNDMMMYVPKKFFPKLKFVHVYHDAWYHLIVKGKMNNDDLDFIINTFHDSDSQKDYNPLYYIVNRPQALSWYDQNKVFDKEKFFEYVHTKKLNRISYII